MIDWLTIFRHCRGYKMDVRRVGERKRSLMHTRERDMAKEKGERERRELKMTGGDENHHCCAYSNPQLHPVLVDDGSLCPPGRGGLYRVKRALPIPISGSCTRVSVQMSESLTDLPLTAVANAATLLDISPWFNSSCVTWKVQQARHPNIVEERCTAKKTAKLTKILPD